jgi:hypothetical protein
MNKQNCFKLRINNENSWQDFDDIEVEHLEMDRTRELFLLETVSNGINYIKDKQPRAQNLHVSCFLSLEIKVREPYPYHGKKDVLKLNSKKFFTALTLRS